MAEESSPIAKYSTLRGFGDGGPAYSSYLSFSTPVLSRPKSRDTDSHDESAHRLEADSVIGIYPQASGCSVLYIDASEASESEPAEQKAVFRHVELESPPQELLDRFPPPGSFFRQLERLRKEPGAGSSSPALHVVVSTGSGQRHAQAYFGNIVKPFLAFVGVETYALHETTSAASVASLARDVLRPAAQAAEQKLVILLSGDGGIVDLLNNMLPAPRAVAKPQVAFLPLGTGNALAHSSGLTSDATLGMSALFRGRPAPLPFFTVRFDPPATPVHADAAATPVSHAAGAVVFSWALHAALVADSDTPAYRALGAARFQRAAHENLHPAPHAYRGALAVRRPGGGAWEDVAGAAHSYVLATLCARLERGFTVSPASGPLDGRVRLVRVGAPIGADALTGLMMAGYQGGGHVRRAEVLYAEVEALRLTMDEDDAVGDEAARAGGVARWRRVCVDGTIFVVPRGGVVELTGPNPDEIASVLDLVTPTHPQQRV